MRAGGQARQNNREGPEVGGVPHRRHPHHHAEDYPIQPVHRVHGGEQRVNPGGNPGADRRGERNGAGEGLNY